MKCIFLNPTKTDKWGGMENWMLKLCSSLPTFGDECLVVGRSSSRWPAVCREHHIAFEPCAFAGDLAPWVVPRLRAICRAFQPDAAIVKGFRQARFMRLARPSATIAVKLPARNELTAALFNRLTFRYCVDRVLTDSEDTRNAFLRFPWVPAHKIAAVHNGVLVPDAPAIPDARIRLREFMGLPPDTLIVGASGRMSTAKAFKDAIQSFAGVHDRAVHLILFGNGPEEPALKQLSAQLGLANRVHFPGWHDDARRLLWGADVFIHPSLAEGLPNTVLESMAGGVPTVATKAGGTAEILEGPLSDYLVDLHNVEGMTNLLNRLLETPTLRLNVGQLARDRVQTHFSIPAMTGSIRTILLAAKQA